MPGGYQPEGVNHSMMNDMYYANTGRWVAGVNSETCGAYTCTCSSANGYVERTTAAAGGSSCALQDPASTKAAFQAAAARCPYNPCAAADPCNVGAHNVNDHVSSHNTCTWRPELNCGFYVCSCTDGFSLHQPNAWNAPTCHRDTVTEAISDRPTPEPVVRGGTDATATVTTRPGTTTGAATGTRPSTAATGTTGTTRPGTAATDTTTTTTGRGTTGTTTGRGTTGTTTTTGRGTTGTTTTTTGRGTTDTTTTTTGRGTTGTTTTSRGTTTSTTSRGTTNTRQKFS